MAKPPIVTILRAKIEAREFVPGSRLPSERFLAQQLGVGRNLIRQAIGQLISEGLVEQHPNCRPVVSKLAPLNQNQHNQPSKIAVWLQPDFQDVGTTLILKGIREIVNSSERQLLVNCAQSGDRSAIRRSAESFLETVRHDASVAGVLLWPSDDNGLIPVYRRLADAGIPIVCIDREPPEGIEADIVAVDHYRGARTVIRHLAELGHRRIAMVNSDDRVSSVSDRTSGYFSALRESGLEADPSLVFEVQFLQEGDLRESAEQVVEAILALPNPPTAIFAVNDQIAMYLHDALVRKGYSVPKDFSLAGFDWFMRWLPSGGDLTTVAQPFEQIGQVAAKRLLDRIGTQNQTVACRISIPAPLVVKTTTAPPASTSVAAATSTF